MKIKTYIQNEVFLPRLNESVVMVVYDDQNRYRETCLEMADEKTTVIDASIGSIHSREQANQTLQTIGASQNLHRMLIYVPTSPPETDPKKIVDPFWVYGKIGSHFPRKASDAFHQICLSAKPDHATEIHKVFSENPNPTFDLIDNIGGGAGWPTLQSVLGVESTTEIVFSLLAPYADQKLNLNSDQPWIPETKQFLTRNLGLNLQTKIEAWSAISDELWRFILFSEFVHDLPADASLPASLTSIPVADRNALPLINKVCERLRANKNSRDLYIEKAKECEETLELKNRCSGINDLGVRDTFPFEERSFFDQAVQSIQSGNLDQARAIIHRNNGSIWIDLGSSQAQWNIIQSILRLVEKCSDCESDLPKHTQSQEKLIYYYVSQFYKVDQFHREFELAITDHIDIEGSLEPAIQYARQIYSQLAIQVQNVFVRFLEKNGWPPSDLPSNLEVFDSHVGSQLKESGQKVAYFLIDALRYELAAELELELSENGKTELHPSFATIPTVTPIGMTSLLPQAQSKLALKRNGDDLAVMMGDTPIKSVDQRMKWIESIYGERFHQVKLESVIQPGALDQVPDSVELLVIRSSSLDACMETEYQAGLPAIKKDMQAIRAAIHRLRKAGYARVVIATDHGFCINTQPTAGDVCRPPSGDWKKLHDRCLVGNGSGDANNWICKASDMGIRADFEFIAGPKSFACYSANNQYFHGGASFQEALVPCLVVDLRDSLVERSPITYSINYKRGAKKVNTLLPVVEIKANATTLYDNPESCAVLLQAIDEKGRVVGEPKPGGHVNPASGTITMNLGESLKIPVRMVSYDEFEGKFTLQLLDVETRALLAKLELQTEYLV